MNIDANELFHRLEEAGNEWSDKEAAASLLEEMTKTMLSECMSHWREESNAAAETKARRDPVFKAHVEKTVEARRLANRARVKWISIQSWIDLKRTEAATERAKVQRGI